MWQAKDPLRLSARELLFASALYAAFATLLIAALALYWAVRDVLFLAQEKDCR